MKGENKTKTKIKELYASFIRTFVNDSYVRKHKGFTLIEILISTAIALILTAVTLGNLVGFRSEKKLDNSAQAIVALLRTAQEKSVNQEDSVRWGVSFYNSSTTKDSFELFQVDETLLSSSSYTAVPGTSTDKHALSAGVEMHNLEQGERLNVVFNKFSGQLNEETAVTIRSSSASSSQRTITISANGRIDNE